MSNHLLGSRTESLYQGLLFLPLLSAVVVAGERTETFDRDPGWEGRNNRSATPDSRMLKQDFGYSHTNHAGRQPGELGGFLTPAAEPAYYAQPIAARTFREPLAAAGALACSGREFHALIGLFNADTVGAWRTPNTIALRVYGRGDVFYAFVEYTTGRYRAGGDSPLGFTVNDPATGRRTQRGFEAKGAVHTWSLRYDPEGHEGAGSISATIDDQTAVCHLAPGHKADGAAFNRFGLLNVMKHADGGGELWLDDVTINGRAESFERDPGWEGRGNRVTLRTSDVRPRFDFGYSPTQFAGGRNAGELGGLVFRGDGRFAHMLAYYADRLDTLKLERPLRASGRVSLRRAVSDSTTMIGFFRARDALVVEAAPQSGLPENMIGLCVEGPSREGFLVYPVYRLRGGAQDLSRGTGPPHILPDGSTHRWSLQYTPAPQGSRAHLEVTLDDSSTAIDLILGREAADVRFDRFGIVTTRIDGNGQHIFFDDLTYTASQD